MNELRLVVSLLNQRRTQMANLNVTVTYYTTRYPTNIAYA